MTWETAPVQYMARVRYGLGQPPVLVDDGDVAILRATNIERGRITEVGLQRTDVEHLPLDRAPLLRADEILVVRSGAYTGDSAIVGTSWAGSAPGYDLRLTPTAATHGRFLSWALLSRMYLDQIELAKARAAQPHINAEELSSVRVPVPPLEEQRRIADYLDAETARIDTLITKNQQAATLVNERFRRLRQELVACGLQCGNPDLGTRLPIFWSLASVWLVSKNHDARRIPLNADERGKRQGPYPYWGANSIQDHIDDWLFEGEHVLIGEDGAPFFDERRDVAWVATGRYWVNNHAHVLEPVDVRASWLAHCLNTTDYSQFVGGSTRDKLTQADLARIPIPKPPLRMQDEILAILQAEANSRDVVIRAMNEQLGLLRERRQAVITEAVTGEITV